MQVAVFPVKTVNALRCQYCQERLSDFDSLPLTIFYNQHVLPLCGDKKGLDNTCSISMADLMSPQSLTTLLNNEWTAVVIYANRHVAFTRKGEDEANFFPENLKLPTLKTVSINIINPSIVLNQNTCEDYHMKVTIFSLLKSGIEASIHGLL